MSRRGALTAALALVGLGTIVLVLALREGDRTIELDGGTSLFIDRAATLGVTRASRSGSPERLFIFENLGSGAALLDFDGDGRLDIFVSNAGTSRRVEGATRGRIELAPGPGVSLYRQQSDGRFEDAGARAGIRFDGWGTGVAVGDIDNDGDLDIFLAAFGPNRLWLNLGGGRFEERSEAAGLAHDGFATSAAFFDADRDGLLDLYVANYVRFDLEAPPNDARPCVERGVPVSCSPPMHEPAPDVLYRNRGDGTFEDVTARAGMSRQQGAYGLGVAVGDIDRDGWPDVLVANDTTANFLWRNRGDGTFEDEALYRGAALSDNAQGQAGMGIDLADLSGDGWLDVHVSNYQDEANAYYESLGDGTFADRSARSGVARASWALLGWGTRFADVDLDGALDLVVVNGHVHPRAAELGTGATFEQPCLLFLGSPGGALRDVTAERGGALATARSHRGLASGDLDGDGDVDLVVTLLEGPPLVLENRASGGAAIGFVLRGRASNREGIGARIELETAAGAQLREVGRGGSYLSGSDATALFGLGTASGVGSARVRWPAGGTDELGSLSAGALYVVEEGTGEARVLRRFERWARRR